ncbi:MAG: serine/threonine protein phosphatase [Bacteroidetes bacterium]|nr:metallophosphoesterase [Rhodothermaceae bacterium RA]RMH61970.1 MAG: serine/threonine protein phosphatase [Bacteroidota bacterium]
MGLIAIGDIHGCARTLDRLLERLAPSADDHLVFVGDYIDRGPDSNGVISRLLALRDQVRCTFLRGNHEALMLGYLDQGEYDLWHVNGGAATLDSYVTDSAHRHVDIPTAHLDFIRSTALYADTPDFFFVHAGLKPHLSIAENLARYDEDVFLWERGHLQARELAWEKCVVCGHTPQPEPINRERLIAIDTGCVYHLHPQLGRLTAVRLPERTFVSVPYEG